MEGKFLMLVVTIIISMGQTSFCRITIAGVIEQNQSRYPQFSNFVEEPKVNFKTEDLSNSVNKLNSILSSFQIQGIFGPPFNQREDDNIHQWSDENNDYYSTRSINNGHKSKQCKNKTRGNGRRFRKGGGNGHNNRGGHREIGSRHSGGGQREIGRRHSGGGHREIGSRHSGEGGSPLGEVNGISAQAAVIGPGSTISGISVTSGTIIQ